MRYPYVIAILVQRLYTGPKTPLHAAVCFNLPQITTYIIHRLSVLSNGKRDGGVNRRFWPEHARELSRKWPLRVETVLATAIRSGQACTASLLLKAGADPNITDAAGTDMMSLCWNCFSCKRDLEKLKAYTNIARLLLEHGWGRCYAFDHEGVAASFNSSATRVMDTILQEAGQCTTETRTATSTRRTALTDISNQTSPSISRKRPRSQDQEPAKNRARSIFLCDVGREYSWQRRKQLVMLRTMIGTA